VPVLAIGGITEHRFEQVARAGAGGIAAIGLFMGSGVGRPACRAIPLDAVADRARALFGPRGRP